MRPVRVSWMDAGGYGLTVRATQVTMYLSTLSVTVGLEACVNWDRQRPLGALCPPYLTSYWVKSSRLLPNMILLESQWMTQQVLSIDMYLRWKMQEQS